MKRYLTLALALIMAMSLTACGGDKPASDASSTTDPSTSTSTPIEGEEQAPDESIQPVEPELKTEKQTVWLQMSKNEFGNLMVYEYDEYGNLITESHSSHGQLTPENTYTYSPDGKMLTRNYHKSDGSINSTTTYTYDDQGRLIEEINMKPAAPIASEHFTYTYDDAAKTMKKTTYSSMEQGKITDEQLFELDDNGNVLRDSKINSDGSQTLQYEYTYDAQGNVLSETDAHNGFTTTHTYDADGKLLKTVSGNEYTTYTYDENGLLVDRVNGLDDGFINKDWDYTYDEAGNRTQMIVHSPDQGTATVYNYEYDAAGNLLHETAEKRYSEEVGEVTKDIAYTYEEAEILVVVE